MTSRVHRWGAGVLLVACVQAPTATAHMRWFAQVEDRFRDARYTMDGVAWLLVALTAAGAAAVWAADRWAPRLPGAALRARLDGGTARWEWRLIAVLSGLMLIDTAWRGTFLAPDLVLPGPGLQTFGMVAQLALAAILLLQLSFVLAGVVIVVAMLLAVAYLPPELALDYHLEFGALAAALICVGPRLSRVDGWIYRSLELDPRRVDHLPLPLIRIGVGATLIVLAVHNKLRSPALALSFLAEHDWNFMPWIGFPGFTNLRFALSAGLAELALGLLLLFGVATRLVTAVLAVFFATTLVALGPLELSGHAPIIGIAVLMLIRGGGRLRRGDEPAGEPAGSTSA